MDTRYWILFRIFESCIFVWILRLMMKTKESKKHKAHESHLSVELTVTDSYYNSMFISTISMS